MFIYMICNNCGMNLCINLLIRKVELHNSLCIYRMSEYEIARGIHTGLMWGGPYIWLHDHTLINRYDHRPLRSPLSVAADDRSGPQRVTQTRTVDWTATIIGRYAHLSLRSLLNTLTRHYDQCSIRSLIIRGK